MGGAPAQSWLQQALARQGGVKPAAPITPQRQIHAALGDTAGAECDRWWDADGWKLLWDRRGSQGLRGFEASAGRTGNGRAWKPHELDEQV